MANVIVSPNMSLPVPVPGVDPGPDWANNLDSSLNIIDGHTHAPGSGVQVTPQGLNINSDLSIQNHNLTSVEGVQFSAPASSSLLTYLYTNAQSGGGVTDLFYNDGAGNVIPLTKAGVVNATLASIPGESYAGGTFTWKQGSGSTIPANFDIGSVTIRPNVAATTFGVVLQPPAGIASQYSLDLPEVPASTSFVTLDSSGTLAATVPIANGITAANISTTAGLNPTGSVILYAGDAITLPPPDGYVRCDGTLYPTSLYPALFAVIGYIYGGSGSNFKVPDTRGIFVRGVGIQNIGGKDYVGTRGSILPDAFQTHAHSPPAGVQWLVSPVGGGSSTTGTGGIVASSAVTSPAGTSNETQPANISIDYIIKT